MKKDTEKEKVKKDDGKSQKCPKCDLSFFKEYLQRHIDTTHEGIPYYPDIGKKPYKCDLCDSDFKTKDELEKHKRKVHEVKKLFQCNICSIGFVTKNLLKII